jgi:hypothetical protein
VDDLLALVAHSGDQPPASPAEQFITEVGGSGSGFILNEPVARGFRLGLAELLGDLERALLNHAAVSGPMGLALALHPLTKLARGPQHLHWHLLPASWPEAEYAGYWQQALADHPGSVEAWAYLAAGEAEADPWIASWEARCSAPSPGPGRLLVQTEESFAPGWLAWAGKSPAAAHVFMGGVSAAVGEGHFFYKPAALAYLEALLQNKASLPGAASESLALSDADVNPRVGSPAHRVYDGESLRALREKGLNVPVGAKNRADLVFLSLAAAPR